MTTPSSKLQFRQRYGYEFMHERPIIVPPQSPLIMKNNKIKLIKKMLQMHLPDEEVIRDYFPEAKIFIANFNGEKRWLLHRLAQAYVFKNDRISVEYTSSSRRKFPLDDVASIYGIKYLRERDGSRFVLLGRFTRKTNGYFTLIADQAFVDSIAAGHATLYLTPSDKIIVNDIYHYPPMDIDVSALKHSAGEKNLHALIKNISTENDRRPANGFFRRKAAIRKKTYHDTSRIFSYENDDDHDNVTDTIKLGTNLIIGPLIDDEINARLALRHIGRALRCLYTGTTPPDGGVVLFTILSKRYADTDERINNKMKFLRRLFSTTTFVEKVSKVYRIEYANELQFQLVGRITMDDASYYFEICVDGSSDGVEEWVINKGYIYLEDSYYIFNSTTNVDEKCNRDLFVAARHEFKQITSAREE